MVKVIFVEVDGTENVVEAHAGQSLMLAAKHNDVRGIVADCGGSCTCATCHVYIEAGFLEAIGQPLAMEQEMLALTVDPQDNSRLSCQIVVDDRMDGLKVRVPRAQY